MPRDSAVAMPMPVAERRTEPGSRGRGHDPDAAASATRRPAAVAVVADRAVGEVGEREHGGDATLDAGRGRRPSTRSSASSSSPADRRHVAPAVGPVLLLAEHLTDHEWASLRAAQRASQRHDGGLVDGSCPPNRRRTGRGRPARGSRRGRSRRPVSPTVSNWTKPASARACEQVGAGGRGRPRRRRRSRAASALPQRASRSPAVRVTVGSPRIAASSSTAASSSSASLASSHRMPGTTAPDSWASSTVLVHRCLVDAADRDRHDRDAVELVRHRVRLELVEVLLLVGRSARADRRSRLWVVGSSSA